MHRIAHEEMKEITDNIKKYFQKTLKRKKKKIIYEKYSYTQ